MKQRIAQLERVNLKLYEVAAKSDYGELRPDFGARIRRSVDFKQENKLLRAVNRSLSHLPSI